MHTDQPNTVAPSAPMFRSSSNPFSAFLYLPHGVRFQTQKTDETIILLLRQHWVTNVPWIVTSVFLILTPVFLFPLLLQSPNISIPTSIITVLTIIWYLFTFSFILVSFLLWYFTVSIVTQERVIDIDYVNILNRRFSETQIKNVEDVTEKMGGILRTLFNYGDVLIQTAGKHPEFEFIAVPRPADVVRIVNNLLGQTHDEGGE